MKTGSHHVWANAWPNSGHGPGLPLPQRLAIAGLASDSAAAMGSSLALSCCEPENRSLAPLALGLLALSAWLLGQGQGWL